MKQPNKIEPTKLAIVIAVAAILLISVAGCISTTTKETNISGGEQNLSETETISAPQILIPEINESEGDFPLPA